MCLTGAYYSKFTTTTITTTTTVVVLYSVLQLLEFKGSKCN